MVALFRGCLAGLCLASTAWAAGGGSPLKPPAPGVITEAHQIVEQMIQSDRGPYSRIRWFCADGTVLPPEPFACRERGGGRQHAEYSADRHRLASLGWHVGTVYAALDWNTLWSGADVRKSRLRELPVERYMVDAHDGWVLHKARDYRGRVQLEDEEAAGRELLLKLLAQRDWVRENLLLVRELVRTIPHGGQRDRTQEVRNLAQEIADQVPAFGRLRIEVHSRPDIRTAAHIRAWLAERPTIAATIREKANRLADGLDDLYGASGRTTRLSGAERQLARSVPEAAEALARARQASDKTERVAALSAAMVALRSRLIANDPAVSLYRLAVLQALETELRVVAGEVMAGPDLSRAQWLQQAIHLVDAAWAGAWLSDGERTALVEPVHKLLASPDSDASAYAQAVRHLALAGAWAAQSVRYAFAEPLVRYTALDGSAARFVDDLVRGSALLPLGDIAHRLAIDAANASGVTRTFLGAPSGKLLALNPGVARARLRVVDPDRLAAGAALDPNDIVVLTETVADLTPVAGILTLGEGNPLSHVQMLARNLGIPNAVVAPSLLPRLQKLDGQQVLLVVAGDGRVYVQLAKDVPPAIDARLSAPREAVERVTVPAPDLAHSQPLRLAELNAGLSGKRVGPKAANVGELAQRFPGQVPAAVALPFGAFASHTAPQRERVADAYAAFRRGELDQAGLDAVLDQVRTEVEGLSLNADLRKSLLQAMAAEFGDAPGYGVFVRSDTNAEDLPGFTGAGLNETLPNVVGRDAQLNAIARVWASVYTRRAMAWRSRILENPEQVFASVLLMESIDADKSGVMVTTDLDQGGPGQTVSAAWGVGGAVDNESASSVVLKPDGDVLLLSEAKAPYRRALPASGGVQWVVAPAGPVLTSADQQALRQLADQVARRYPPVSGADGKPLPWDIEFAFKDGKLWLLQIRPLVQRGDREANELMDQLVPRGQGGNRVSLSEAPYTQPEGS